MMQDASSKQLKLSVIVPVYNAEQTLRRCLDSLCAQTYGNFELILVNDGSKDHSLEICNEYAKKDQRICVYTQENAGPSAARNRGLDMASGDYVLFVDSDDYVEANMLQRMADAAAKEDADLVLCSYWDEKGDVLTPHVYARPSGVYDEQGCKELALDFIDDNTKGRIPPYSSLRLVRRSFMEESGLRFTRKVKRGEDYLLWVQVHFQAKRLVLLAEDYLYHYVYTETSITKSYLPNYWPMCLTIFSELNEKLPQTKEVKERIQAMLIQRSLIALHNAALADEAQFKKDCDEILNDKTLKKAARAVGLRRNSKRARIYALLLILGLKGLVIRIFSKER
ncbi:MAG: glycosyltransferase family 2 protein [Clostridiales bacterium]|nr:glycosyltransferase family 2 protein [Clostridiales bacterium]